jgi:hypothetical protein
MAASPLGKLLRRLATDSLFREHASRNLGTALAEEGFVLTDEEMHFMREIWEGLAGLDERQVHERLAALARSRRYA